MAQDTARAYACADRTGAERAVGRRPLRSAKHGADASVKTESVDLLDQLLVERDAIAKMRTSRAYIRRSTPDGTKRGRVGAQRHALPFWLLSLSVALVSGVCYPIVTHSGVCPRKGRFWPSRK